MARRSNAELTESTRHALLDAARTAFAEHGYADAPIESLVRGLGLTKGALYHHFGSKEGLFVAVAQAIDADIMKRVHDAAPGEPVTMAEFVAACRTFLEATLEPGVCRILLIDFPAVVGYRRAREMDEVSSIRPIKAALQQMSASGEIGRLDIESTARLLNGAMYEAALWLGEHRRPRLGLEQVMESLARLLTALRPTASEAPRRKRG